MVRGGGTDREYRAPLLLKIAAGIALALFAAAAGSLYLLEGWTLWSVVALCLALVAVAGVGDVLTSRVVLKAESIVIVRNLRRREYARSLFVKATWAKGVPVALQCANGEWVALPPVGKSSQAMVNTLRAWIGRQRDHAGGQSRAGES